MKRLSFLMTVTVFLLVTFIQSGCHKGTNPFAPVDIGTMEETKGENTENGFSFMVDFQSRSVILVAPVPEPGERAVKSWQKETDPNGRPPALFYTFSDTLKIENIDYHIPLKLELLFEDLFDREQMEAAILNSNINEVIISQQENVLIIKWPYF